MTQTPSPVYSFAQAAPFCSCRWLTDILEAVQPTIHDPGPWHAAMLARHAPLHTAPLSTDEILRAQKLSKLPRIYDAWDLVHPLLQKYADKPGVRKAVHAHMILELSTFLHQLSSRPDDTPSLATLGILLRDYAHGVMAWLNSNTLLPYCKSLDKIVQQRLATDSSLADEIRQNVSILSLSPSAPHLVHAVAHSERGWWSDMTPDAEPIHLNHNHSHTSMA